MGQLFHYNQRQSMSAMRTLTMYQHAHSDVPRVAQNSQFADDNRLGYANNYGGAMRPIQPTFVVTGYLHSSNKATDHYRGEQLQNLLRDWRINMEMPPPFRSVAAFMGYASHGVVKVNNIPFTVTVQEVAQFIARYTPNNPMLKKNHEGCPIHIVMEKPTGKTMDCFVEFPSHEAARECVTRFEQTAQPGRGTKLGTRNVSLDLSDQAELMNALFPRARLVRFDEATGQPNILNQDENPSWSAGFRGYFTLEEIYGVTRFAENPARSPFVLKCVQRPYECMISTLYKFPWGAAQTYTVAARNALFETAYKQLGILSKKVGLPMISGPATSIAPYNPSFQGYGHGDIRNHNPYGQDQYSNQPASDQREVGLSQGLLVDLLFAALNVPVFSQLQKIGLCQQAGSYGRGITLGTFAQHWPFQTLQPLQDVPDHIIKFWLELLDTGYEVLTGQDGRTTYEHYLAFNRNKIGFVVAEWTPAGVQLPFEDAARIEINVMMILVNLGRIAWAAERGLRITQWNVTGLLELFRLIADEKEAGRHFESGEGVADDRAESNISPTTTEFNYYAPARAGSDKNPGAQFGAIGNSHASVHTPTTNSKFNVATAADFVPASASREGPTPGITYERDRRPTDISALSIAEQVRTHIAGVPDIGASSIHGMSAQGPLYNGAPPGLSTTSLFRDPWSPTSNQNQGFTRSIDRNNPQQYGTGSGMPAPPSFPNMTDDSFRSLYGENVAKPIDPGYTAHGGTRPHSDGSISSVFGQNNDYSSMGEQMQKLTLDTRLPSNDSSSRNTSASYYHQPTPSSTNGSSMTSVTTNDNDAPESKSVQKYPNITYTSTARTQPISQARLGPIGSRTPHPATDVHTTPALSALTRANERLRTRSIPMTTIGEDDSDGITVGPSDPRSTLDKRPSLPITTTNGSARASQSGQRENDAKHTGSGAGAEIERRGRLSAGELWSNVGRY